MYERTHRRDGVPPGGRSVSETDEEDWFEKALQNDEEVDDDTTTDGDTETDEIERIDDETGATVDDETGATVDDETSTPTPDDSGAADTADLFGGDQPDGSFDGVDADPGNGSFDDIDAGSFGGGDETIGGDDSLDGQSDDGGDDPFGGVQPGDDTGSVDGQPDTDGSGGDSFTEGDDPFGGVQSGDASGATGDAESDPFGGSRSDDSGTAGVGGSDDPFGGARSGPGGGDTPFGEGFDEAMGGGMGGGEGTEFDEAEFESEIDRIDVGIEGLDDMILGGVPIRSLMTVIGSAGTGKTTFGLQFLHQTMESGGSGVYITLEETEEAIVSTAEEKGWPFEQYVADDQLIVVAMDPIEMANSLDSIRGDISRLVNEFGADRLVLDSVSLLEMMYDHPAKRRSEVFDFARSLKRAGVTTMLTSEANADNSYQSRHGLVEYLVDAVFVLQYVRPNDFQETRLAVEIQKIRDANHSRETKPYDITDEGISVYRQANIF